MTQETEDYRQLPEENFDQPLHRRGESKGGLRTRHEYYWILARDPTTSGPIILGAYNTMEEANQVGFQKIHSGQFEVIPLLTRDADRANHMLKYRNFHKLERLEEIVKRAKHERSMNEH